MCSKYCKSIVQYCTQARRLDFAAGGPKTTRGGHILKIKYWMYAATERPNMKWGEQILNGRARHHCPRWRRP